MTMEARDDDDFTPGDLVRLANYCGSGVAEHGLGVVLSTQTEVDAPTHVFILWSGPRPGDRIEELTYHCLVRVDKSA